MLTYPVSCLPLNIVRCLPLNVCICVFIKVSVVVKKKKYHDQKGEYRKFFLFHFIAYSLLWKEVKTGTQDRSLDTKAEERPQSSHVNWLVLHSLLGFFILFRGTCPGVGPLWKNGPSHMKQMSLQACTQAKLTGPFSQLGFCILKWLKLLSSWQKLANTMCISLLTVTSSKLSFPLWLWDDILNSPCHK